VGTKSGLQVDNFSIGRNLFAFLETVRCKTETLTLWVDAVCINQNKNSPEKAIAVAMMDTIYRNAKRTIIWLGESSADSSKAMKTVREFNKGDFVGTALNPKDEKWVAVRKLLRRRWWSRLWVLQECLLSCDPLTVRCGIDTAPLDKFIELRLAQDRYNAQHTRAFGGMHLFNGVGVPLSESFVN
jgi:hypothetical protein